MSFKVSFLSANIYLICVNKYLVTETLKNKKHSLQNTTVRSATETFKNKYSPLSSSKLMKIDFEYLTGGLVPVVAYSDVVLLVAVLGSGYLLHLSDFRHAEFGVVVEEHPTTRDGQVVLGPVPQLSEVLVVQRIEGVNSRTRQIKKLNTT